MNKKRTISLIALAMMLMMAVFTMAGCGKPTTLEGYIESDSDVQEQIDDIKDSQGVEVSCEGNDLTFDYSLSTDIPKSQMSLYKSSFKKASSSYTSTFTKIVKQLEEETELEGIQLIVNYKDKSGDEIYSATYNNEGVVK